MLDIPAFVAEKNLLFGDGFRLLVEINYDDAGGGQFFRACRDSADITFEGHTWTAFAVGNPVRSQRPTGQIPTFDLPLSNVGRVIQALIEQYIVEGRPGRLITVHRDHLGDPTAKFEEPFTIVSATCAGDIASLTCASVRFNWLTALIPAEVVTRSRYPGVLGSRSRFF